MNSDPLCNVDFLSDVNMRAKEVKGPTKGDSKNTLTRTVSESGIDDHKHKRSAVVLDKAIFEDDIFSVKPNSENLDKQKEKKKSTSRAIFSDSESVDVNASNSPKKSSKGKGPAHTHKRSRSDISGIKKTLTPVEISGQSSNHAPPHTDSTASFDTGKYS